MRVVTIRWLILQTRLPVVDESIMARAERAFANCTTSRWIRVLQNCSKNDDI